ncbi:hypothetical protein H9Q70_014637, partial [Fusarium xylarioides]
EAAFFLTDHHGEEPPYPRSVLTAFATFLGAIEKAKKANRRSMTKSDLKLDPPKPKQIYKTSEPTKIHRNALPPPPKTWQELETHAFKELFLAAAHAEVKKLIDFKT